MPTLHLPRIPRSELATGHLQEAAKESSRWTTIFDCQRYADMDDVFLLLVFIH